MGKLDNANGVYNSYADLHMRIKQATRTVEVVKERNPRERHSKTLYLVKWMSYYHPGDPSGEYRWAWRGQWTYEVG